VVLADEVALHAYVGLLIELGPVEPWQRDALCREHPDVEFFIERGASSAPAKAICRCCAVRDECLAYALAQPSPFPGIWGGLSERERRRIKRERQLAA
jgi:WhiB family redox-sensing transcriptional regulator